MAFSDEPEVDDNSIRSEESVNAVRCVLTRRNGFLCREETPDYGVDMDVELVTPDKRASSQKFAVQIKSTGKVKLTTKNGIQYCTLTFKTSRLGYLCKRPPAYGIIVLFDEIGNKSYFDYVDSVVSRLDEYNPEWKSQANATIYIETNELNEESAKALHKKMLARHENQSLMLTKHGQSYGIPVFSEHIKSPDEIDFSSPQNITRFLEQYGHGLLNTDSMDMLLWMLEQLPAAVINKSNKLLFIGAITYGSAGYIIEAEPFLRRCFNEIDSFSPTEQELLHFTKARTSFLKGEITTEELGGILSELVKSAKNEANILGFKINIVYTLLLHTFANEVVDETIEQQIDSIFSEIEASGLTAESKAALQVFNAENLYIYTDKLIFKHGYNIRIQERLGALSPEPQWVKIASYLLSLSEKSRERVLSIYKEYRGSDNKRVLGYAMLALAKMFQSSQFTSMLVFAGKSRSASADLDKVYETHLKLALSAYNCLIECALYKDAHVALGTSYDIRFMAEKCFGISLNTAEYQEIENCLIELEKRTGIRKFVSVVEEAYYGMQQSLEEPKKLQDYSDADMEFFARRILEAYNLPPDRIGNVMVDIASTRLFEKYAKGKGWQLLQNQNRAALGDMSYAYIEPPTFVLVNTAAGWRSLPNKDVRYLLKQFGLMPKDALD